MGGARRTLRELRTERRWVLWLEPPRGAVRAYTQPIIPATGRADRDTKCGGGCFTNQHTSATLRRFCTAPTPTPRAARWQLRGLLHV